MMISVHGWMRKTSIWGNRTGKANFFPAYCIIRLAQMQFATPIECG